MKKKINTYILKRLDQGNICMNNNVANLMGSWITDFNNIV